MENQLPKTPIPSDADEPGSLESTATVVVPAPVMTPVEEAASSQTTSPPPVTSDSPVADSSDAMPVVPKTSRLKRLTSHFGPNIYLVAFFAVVILAVGIVVFAVMRGNSANQTPTVSSQDLTPAELSQLQGTNPVVGDSKENLTIESNTTFNDSVLVKDNVSVAGTLKIGGSLNLPGISVSGTSSFGQVNANSLNVSGAVVAQGTVTVQKSLSVAGTGSFSSALSAPQITTSNLLLQGDLQISQHITTNGGAPSKTDNSTLGNGGTAAISGTDTAGTVNINTGNNPVAGCFVTLTFSHAFSSTPHVVLTATNTAAAGLQYYVTPSNTNFSVCANNPTSGQVFTFDYFVID
jgi:cytoskeletal protein CcmA (bactofilin family)